MYLKHHDAVTFFYDQSFIDYDDLYTDTTEQYVFTMQYLEKYGVRDSIHTQISERCWKRTLLWRLDFAYLDFANGYLVEKELIFVYDEYAESE